MLCFALLALPHLCYYLDASKADLLAGRLAILPSKLFNHQSFISTSSTDLISMDLKKKNAGRLACLPRSEQEKVYESRRAKEDMKFFLRSIGQKPELIGMGLDPPVTDDFWPLVQYS